jgi:hypothetical protein
MEELRLSDETIGHLAKILQLALLTGTDVVDNMRTIRLSLSKENTIVPHPKYVDRFHLTIEDMLSEQLQSELKATIAEASDVGIISKENIDSFYSALEDSKGTKTIKDAANNEQTVEDNKESISEDVDEW